MTARGRLALACAALICTACAHRLDEAELQAVWRAALLDDDPTHAWDLMTPEAQASTDRAAFDARWAANGEVRRALAMRMEAPTDARLGAIEAASVHATGHVVRWAWIDGDFWVVSDVSDGADRRTPAAALAAFAAALHNYHPPSLDGILGPEYAEELARTLSRRADSIEAFLRDPSRIVVDGDTAKAAIEPGVTIRLERGDDGWRVVATDE